MKNPKEILFEKHQNAAPKLDAIRAAVVERIDAAPVRATFSWHEFLRPLRWHLAGMSAAWVVVLLLHHEPSPVGLAAVTPGDAPTPQQVLAGLRENRLLLLSLLQTSEDADAPVAPERHSEANCGWPMASRQPSNPIYV